jgi:hypothetical protein
MRSAAQLFLCTLVMGHLLLKMIAVPIGLAFYGGCGHLLALLLLQHDVRPAHAHRLMAVGICWHN